MAAKSKAPPRPRFNREDPDEEAWQGAYRAAYDHNRAALERFQADLTAARAKARGGKVARVKVPQLIEAPSLPDFGASRPEHVTRELLGRYLHDRDTGLVHDCYAAAESCALDEIRNGTFIHFGGELDGALPDDATACACMAEEA